MHIFFSGIGGTAIGPLALLASQAGYSVSGSDKQDSQYIEYLKKKGIVDIHIGQDEQSIAKLHQQKPIDWFVYSSAVAIENPNSPELEFCRQQNIRMSKRDELINEIITQKNLKLIAIAGTHGKTTTTSMAVWLCQQLKIPISYTLASKTSFADMAHYSDDSEYFVYECDEYDRNFLQFSPHISLITGIDWDHPDIFPTQDDYNQAFRTFIDQSASTFLWDEDAGVINVAASENVSVMKYSDSALSKLPGEVNRKDAALVANGLIKELGGSDIKKFFAVLDEFPGVSRRFERITDNLYSDYAHTPPKIRGALQLGHEVAGDKLVVVYEGLHNTRQHFIRHELVSLFDTVKQLYIVPSYLAREDETLELLTPEKLKNGLSSDSQTKTTSSQLDEALLNAIDQHIKAGDTVLFLTAGGGGSLDEWLRKHFAI